MRDFVVLICLAPVLIIQAIWVKWKTPRLAEARGKRVGVVEGALPAFRILILGDSAAAGVGVEHQRDALCGQLLQQLNSGCQIEWQLLAQSGLNSRTLIRSLESRQPQRFDLVILSIGVNDVTRFVSFQCWCEQQQQLQQLIDQKFERPSLLITAIPPFEYFPALPNTLKFFLARRAFRFNWYWQSLLVDEGRTKLVRVDLPVDAQHFAKDGFHPSASAYRSWAQQCVLAAESLELTQLGVNNKA